MRQSLTAENWAASKVETFPPRWKGRIYRKWESQVEKAELLPCVIGGRGEARRAAGVALCEITDKLAQVRLPLDATDSEICRRASQFANDVIDLARIHHDLKAVRRCAASLARLRHPRFGFHRRSRFISFANRCAGYTSIENRVYGHSSSKSRRNFRASNVLRRLFGVGTPGRPYDKTARLGTSGGAPNSASRTTDFGNSPSVI